MQKLKPALVGIVGSVVMFIIMMLGIHSGMAPFNITPSAAFLQRLGVNVGPLALLVHLGYGALWSILLVQLFQEKTNIARGIGLALCLWLALMLIYSPIIGWGLFGFGEAGQLAPDDPFHLAPGPKYLLVTLILHLIYGTIIGWLNPLWISFKSPTAETLVD